MDILTEDIIINQLLTNKEYKEHVITSIQPEYFSDPVKKELIKEYLNYVSNYGTLPNIKELYITLEKKPIFSGDQIKKLQTYILKVAKREEYNLESLKDITEEFIQDQAIKIALMESLDLSKSDEKHRIPEILKNALSVSLNTTVGLDYLNDVEERYSFYNSKEEKISFGINALNDLTEGGIPRKTLNLIMGAANSGKTLFCSHLASDYLKDQNVLYITLEVAEKIIGNRIDANLYNLSMKDVRELSLEQMKEKIRSVQLQKTGRLFIKEYPTSTVHVGHFRKLLNELKIKKSFDPDIILIDYLGLMLSVRGNIGSGDYSYVKRIAEELRGLFVEYNVGGWSPIQTNRTGYGNMDLSMDNTGESYGLNSTADFICAIMRNEQLDAQGRIMLKEIKTRYRNNSLPGSTTFPLKVDIDKMKFYDVDDTSNIANMTRFNGFN